MIKKILCFLFLIPLCLQAQQTMTGTFAPAENFKWFIIYKLKTTRQEYVANGKITEGKLNYTFEASAEKGMYRLVYGLPQEEKNFDFIYSGEEDIVFNFSDEQLDFTASKENQLHTSYFANINEAKRMINSYYQSGDTNKESFLEIFKSINTLQETFEKEAKGTIAYNFIKASRTYIPTSYETPQTMVSNIKKHYFDAVDFTNPVLQNSDFIAEKVSNYVFTALPMKEFTGAELVAEYKKNIATVVEKMQAVPADYKKTLLYVLWEQMVMVENQEIAIHIGNTYLKPIAKQLNDDVLVEKVNVYERLAIGQKAPEISWTKDNKTHKLSELDSAENYIIVFWSSGCSHCLMEMPKLKTFVNSKEKGTIKVIAIGLEDERENWANESSFYPEFIHILGLDKWDNEIGNLYDVTATPTFFVLDKDKRIIAKPYGVKELKEFYTKK
ncbi:thiol-disulfide isomerase/thioredoxin [Kordia periserrulae]|uniref:Thiol-disulfide isomerase/thioredoxin n=1 Tax=Kordia periserrulae TaxID=701523 RepID=A0A2T6BVJ9_9FLAO|nr:thioredoxin family protein [Kordia periserrulae]PTX60083.1 thiol-disulfide isomerase/thioredoxin [Kordia periserrulae]